MHMHSNLQEPLNCVIRNRVICEEIADGMRKLGYEYDWKQTKTIKSYDLKCSKLYSFVLYEEYTINGKYNILKNSLAVRKGVALFKMTRVKKVIQSKGVGW